jgi:hypothetical protein
MRVYPKAYRRRTFVNTTFAGTSTGRIGAPPTTRRRPRVERAKIFYFAPEKRWACSTPFLGDSRRKMNAYLFVLKHECDAEWCDDARTWLVPEEHLARLRALVQEFFGDYDFVEKKSWQSRPAPGAAPVVTIDYIAIFQELAGVAPTTRSATKSAWRQAVLRWHPDQGGDSEKLFQLNQAWSAISDTLPE